jgi:hypothetical protein
MYWKRPQVLGVNLNPSESSRPPLPFAPPHSATASCSKWRLIRCTVPGLTPNCLAMTRTRHDHVEFATRGITAQLVERWPLSRPLVPLMP